MKNRTVKDASCINAPRDLPNKALSFAEERLAAKPSADVFVLGAHPLNGFSMRRYTNLLEKAYQDMGWQVQTLRPISVLSRSLGQGALRKFAIYLEKLVLFPFALWKIPKSALVHVADHSDAIWLLHPRLRMLKSVVTCHDLFAIQAAQGLLPEYSPRWPGRLYQYLIGQGLQGTQQVISVSECTARDVRGYLPDMPCEVVRNPLDQAFIEAETRAPKGYALVVGANDWRKRRILAISVWIRTESHRAQPRELVLVGPNLTEAEVGLINAAGVDKDSVTTVSRIPEDELIRMYAEADYLILASKYEGFAWPIIEANALGVPVLCADEPILRETGLGNVFFDPVLDNNDWDDLLSRLEGLRQNNRLTQRAKSFSQQKFVRELAEVVDFKSAPHSPLSVE